MFKFINVDKIYLYISLSLLPGRLREEYVGFSCAHQESPTNKPHDDPIFLP